MPTGCIVATMDLKAQGLRRSPAVRIPANADSDSDRLRTAIPIDRGQRSGDRGQRLPSTASRAHSAVSVSSFSRLCTMSTPALVPSFGSIGTILPPRPARASCRRAQWRSRMARLRATASAARSVLDGREHDGRLDRVGGLTPHTPDLGQKERPRAAQKAAHAHLPDFSGGLRRVSPSRARRCAVWTRRSRTASAIVGSTITSCQ